MSKLLPAIVELQKEWEESEKELEALNKKRDDIRARAVAIQGKCPHKEKRQQRGAFAVYCTACDKRVQ